MSWLPRLLARSIRASSSSHARTTSAPAPVSARDGGAGECPRFPVIDPLDRDVAPDDPDTDRDPDVEDDRRLGLRLCAVPGRTPGAGNTSGCCGFMYRYGNGASPDPARAIVFRFVVSVIPAPDTAPAPCTGSNGSGGTSMLMLMLSRPRSCGPALVCGRRLFFRAPLFVGDPDPLARGSNSGADGTGLGTGGGEATGSVPTATAASAVLGGTYASAKWPASGAARTRASSAPADDDPGAVAARRRSAERACASAKCADACRRSASFVSTALSSRGARSIVSVPVVGDVTITCGVRVSVRCSAVRGNMMQCGAEANKADADAP